MDKENIVKKFGLVCENGVWYSNKENSHKHLIFKDSFFKRSDVIGLLFRINKLCMAKVTYFRKNIDKFESYKLHYEEGFIAVPLWDAEFFKHKASGFMIDLRYLQSITVYSDFIAFCEKFESYEKCKSG